MPPSWVVDEDVWKRAEEAVRPESPRSRRRFTAPYAVVAHVYRNMGGRVRKRTRSRKTGARARARR